MEIELELPIQGMRCSACVARVEQGLRAIPGVLEVQVNLLTAVAYCRLTDGFQVQLLVDALMQAGYQVPIQVVELQLSSMRCGSCVARVEQALATIPQVLSVQVNLLRAQAQIQWLGTEADRGLLASRLLAAGYPVQPEVEPVSATTDDIILPWYQPWMRPLIALVLVAPMWLVMLAHLVGGHWLLPLWLQAVLATPVQFILGAGFYRAAWAALKTKQATMDLLICLGSSAAYALSVYLWWSQGENAPVYFEVASSLICLVLWGKALEQRAVRQTGAALRGLQQLLPERVWVRRDQQDIELPLAQVGLNELLVIQAGQRIGFDAEVVSGQSYVDESLVTGESMPVNKQPGARVIGGSINGDGLLLARVTALTTNSLLAQMIRLVEQAQMAKAPIQRLVDRVAAVFVPIVLLVALLTLAVWGVVFADWQAGWLNAIAVLVVACPCALGLATPAALMVGTGAAAKLGILITNIDALQRAERIKVVVFDKTGTLSQGQPRLVEQWLATTPLPVALWAVSMQRGSSHPLALALRQAIAQQPLAEVSNIQVLAGLGVSAQVAGRQLALGSPSWLQQWPLDLSPIDKQLQSWQDQGHSLMLLAEIAPQPQLLAAFAFADSIRPESAAAVQALKAAGLRTVLVSGDHVQAVQRVAEQLGLDQYYAAAMPADKVAKLTQLQAEYGAVAMVGDGINDAPALAAADLGIAMALGADVAKQAAAMRLVRSDPRLVLVALLLSRQTLRRIRQNLFWASIYNLLAIPLAACGGLNPVVAAAAMALSSLSVLANALLLQGWRPPADLVKPE